MVESSNTPLFGEGFLDKYAGHIIDDPEIAIVELVANAWDAHATRVDISWPTSEKRFQIADNGGGMTGEEFERRWRTLDYQRTKEQGRKTTPPPSLRDATPRSVYGRNGRGRHAAFHFGNPYTVITTKEGVRTSYLVSRSSDEHHPFQVEKIAEVVARDEHGTTIIGDTAFAELPASHARKIIGTRFLTDPDFQVFVDGVAVTFEDLDDDAIQKSVVEVQGLGTARVWMIDAQKSDRSNRQHGIAWWVNSRLVGECRWRGQDLMSIVDGRTAEAKRFTFIVFADFLEEAVKEDWSDFDQKNELWKQARAEVSEHIRALISQSVSERRAEAKSSVRERLSGQASRLPPSSREVWDNFIDSVIDNCPSISVDEVTKIAEILANLEASTSKYDLLHKLHELNVNDLDGLNSLLEDWSVRTLKEALDEIKIRLSFIREMHSKLHDPNSDEVHDLQPLFDQSLWAFGPEFESIEFTSNRGMTTVIRRLLKASDSGSLNRPDYVVLPDASIGTYARPSFDESGEIDGFSRVVIVELKRPGIQIGAEQMNQAMGYSRELLTRGAINLATSVDCFVLGSTCHPVEAAEISQSNIRVRSLSFDAFIRRAEARMLNLYETLRDSPFLRDAGIDADVFVEGDQPAQPSMRFAK